MSAPHRDNKLEGHPSIAIGFGDVEGGQLKVEGYDPVSVCGKAVVVDGLTTHSSSKINGDRWSLVFFTHASWASVSKILVHQIRNQGLDCPGTFSNAVAAERTGPDAEP